MTNTATQPELETPVRPALSNAERQRRYRERHKCPRNESNGVSASEANAVQVLCAQQDEIDISFDEDGDAVITQKRWPDEDQTIIISRENIDVFIDRLTDALGIPSFGRP